jgi:hypothetical protein
MIRMRCPHQGCPINVADELAGKRIRCPHCEQFLVVDAADRRGASEQIQAVPPTPPLELEPRPSRPRPDPAEDRLYEGLPPLSVMLALREGRGPRWKDDRELRDQMTPDDWKALDAFETVLIACASLSRSIWFVMIAALVTVLFPVALDLERYFAVCAVLTPSVFGIGCLLMNMSRWRLRRLQSGVLVGLAKWAALGIALWFFVYLALSLPIRDRDRYEPAWILMVFAATLQGIAAVSAVNSILWVRRAQEQLGPPAILQRLRAALVHLESVSELL